MRVCTITTRGSAARARVMAASLLEHHPGARIIALCLDGTLADAPGGTAGEALDAGQLIGQRWGLLAAANPPGALAHAALGHLLRRLFEDDEEPVTYVGEGVRVLAPLDALLDAQHGSGVVLVGRAWAGMLFGPSGGIRSEPSGDNAYSRHLLGFAAGRSLDALLAGWPECFAAEHDGADAVREFVDRIPALADDVHVLREPGYAIDREFLAGAAIDADTCVAGPGGTPFPVRTVDLSALRPDDTAAWAAGALEPLSVSLGLRRLVERQASDLLAAGWTPEAEAEHPYTALDDGLRLTPTVRALIREGLAAGQLSCSPFTAEGRAELYALMGKPSRQGADAGLTALHHAIWLDRRDLQEAYPHLDGPDGPGYAGWLCEHGIREEGLVAELLPPAPDLSYRDADPEEHLHPPRLGVNVVGFFTSELGIGEVARQLMGALDAAETPAIPLRGSLAPPSREGESFEYAGLDAAAYPVNLLCINGDGVPVFAREAGRSFFAGRYTIGYWWWEVGEPPASWTPAYEFVEEVWVASQYVYDALAPGSPRPVVKMTLPVALPRVSDRSRAELGLPQEAFVFLFPYDYHSVYERKNPLAVIDAFAGAFPPGSGAKLVLKSLNAKTHPEQHERVLLAAAAHADIQVLDGYLSTLDKNAMIARSDCLVSLHRSEGFGLGLAEAMLLGKPVIATRFGGNLEFMNDGNSYLVDHRLVAVGEGVYPYPPDGRWADPSREHAAELMRRVFEDREGAAERGARAREELLARHAPAVAGGEMRRRVELIRARMHEGGVRTLSTSRLPPKLEPREFPASPWIKWGSDKLSRLRWRAAKPVADWAGPFIEHQSRVAEELRFDIEQLDAWIAESAAAIREDQAAQHAELMAEVRRLLREIEQLGKR